MFWRSRASNDDIELASFKAAIMIYCIDTDEGRPATVDEIDFCVKHCVSERQKKFNDFEYQSIKTTAIILSTEQELMQEMYEQMMSTGNIDYHYRSRCTKIVTEALKKHGFLK